MVKPRVWSRPDDLDRADGPDVANDLENADDTRMTGSFGFRDRFTPGLGPLR